MPFPAAPPVAGGTVVLPPAGPPSTAGTPAKPAPASPEDKQKAKAEIRQKQEEATRSATRQQAGRSVGLGGRLAGRIKSGADLGVNILSTVTGPAGKSIKSAYDTLSVIADHTGGAIADGNVRGHITGAVSDVASGKLTDMMTSKVGDAAGWAGGKLADKIGKALPGQIKQTVAGGIDSISNKISGRARQATAVASTWAAPPLQRRSSPSSGPATSQVRCAIRSGGRARTKPLTGPRARPPTSTSSRPPGVKSRTPTITRRSSPTSPRQPSTTNLAVGDGSQKRVWSDSVSHCRQETRYGHYQTD